MQIKVAERVHVDDVHSCNVPTYYKNTNSPVAPASCPASCITTQTAEIKVVNQRKRKQKDHRETKWWAQSQTNLKRCLASALGLGDPVCFWIQWTGCKSLLCCCDLQLSHFCQHPWVTETSNRPFVKSKLAAAKAGTCTQEDFKDASKNNMTFAWCLQRNEHPRVWKEAIYALDYTQCLNLIKGLFSQRLCPFQKTLVVAWGPTILPTKCFPKGLSMLTVDLLCFHIDSCLYYSYNFEKPVSVQVTPISETPTPLTALNARFQTVWCHREELCFICHHTGYDHRSPTHQLFNPKDEIDLWIMQSCSSRAQG